MVEGHRTITRVTRILEEVVYRPGISYAELTRALEAPKSSVYGFIRGLLDTDWLVEQDHRLYLGPAFFSLTIASGDVRAGLVSTSDLETLHQEAGLTAFVGVRSGDSLLYIAHAGSDVMTVFQARSNIRRSLLTTAGGRGLLATLSTSELQAYLRRRGADEVEKVERFLAALPGIRQSGVAVSVNATSRRTGVAVVLPHATGRAIAAVTLVGESVHVDPRVDELGELIKCHIGKWRHRSGASVREPL